MERHEMGGGGMNDILAALAAVIAKQELEIHRLRAELAQAKPKED